MRAFISIKINWTISSQERPNGYVIEYTTGGGGNRNVVSTTEDEIHLSLSMGHTYAISVYSYVDLPSVTAQTKINFDGKFNR